MNNNNILKISPKELRVGNYIDFKYTEEDIVQIDGITDEYPILSIITFDEPLWDELEPIPINKTWMLDFGFKTENEEFIKNGIVFEVDKSYPTLALKLKGNYGTSIKYVHQLQNLYYALTNCELLLEEYHAEY